MQLNDVESYIRIKTQALGEIHNRKVTEGMISVFTRALHGYPIEALEKGFRIAEEQLERFATPKKMIEICNDQMPSGMWRYTYKSGVGPDGVACLIDPDPDCDTCHKRKSEHPTAHCDFVDNRQSRYLYRAVDCEEGRAFLAALAKLAENPKKKRFAFPKPAEAL